MLGLKVKVSTKGRYALRLVAELARLEVGEKIAIKEIADKQALSEKYLEQLVRPLMRAKIVKSSRGAQGGYCLAAPPDTITVGQVLRASEGDLGPVDCVSTSSNGCPRADSCETMFVWRALKEATDAVIDGITIADIAAQHGLPCPPNEEDQQETTRI